jgi:hypothetical protein
MPRLAVSSFALAIACASCAKGTGSSPFDVQGAAPNGITAADDPDAEPEDDDEPSSEDGSDDADGGDSSSGVADDGDDSSSEAGLDESSSSGGPAESDGDADAGEQPGGQPLEGMYSSCAVPADCVGVNLCVTILDPMQVPLGGFCTSPGCANAAVDCVATPGGTATPMCLPLTVNDMPDAACALDCGGGKTCPAGMECIDVTGASICV